MSGGGARLAAGAARLLDRVPLVVKVGLPVLTVSIGSALLLERATTAEILAQCALVSDGTSSVCADDQAISAIGAKVALLAADITAVTLVALWLVFHTFVLRPAGRLAHAAARVADGDLEVRLGAQQRPGTRDELVRVSVEFDRMVASVAEHQRQLRNIVDTAYDAFVSADSQGRVVDWSSQAERLFGWTREEAVGLEMAGLVVPERYREQHRAGLASAAQSGDGPVMRRPLELPALHRAGHEVPVELVVWSTDVDGERRFHSFVRDISERKRMEAQLTHQAFHDALTGLANRTLFHDRLEHALQRPGAGVGVVFCDLDDFKTVNDSMGHAAGDRLLLVVAERLRSALRPSDTLARLAGDEFAVLVEDASDAQVDAVAERLLEALAAPVPLDGREVLARASLGVATTATLTAAEEAAGQVEAGDSGTRSPAPGVSAPADALMRNADAAMYAAKRRGKDVVERFAPEMHAQAVQRLRLRADLHGALDRGELRLDYQPYVDATTNRITGCEALLRWDHPAHGPVPPTQFIPLAEETGFIRELGRWVLSEACTQLALWQHEVLPAPQLTMSVNVSVRQLEDSDFVADVARVLRSTGVDPAWVVLEVTESVFSHDQETVVQRLEALKAIGVSIALDDFGTGYSSLAWLGHVPVDVVKIDRSFVVPLDAASAADSSMVTAILQIGASRNLRTVAEGVETREQLDALRELGCDLVQGYVFHRPMGPDLLAERLREEQHAAVPAELPAELPA
jgi:diguanylate cyclase (GGDEF)-like protein/PAS domain S-box-containing protein